MLPDSMRTDESAWQKAGKVVKWVGGIAVGLSLFLVSACEILDQVKETTGFGTTSGDQMEIVKRLEASAERHEQAARDLQCTPATVHAETVAERDEYKNKTLSLGIDLETRDEIIRELRGEIERLESEVTTLEASVDNHALEYHNEVAAHQVTKGQVEEMALMVVGFLSLSEEEKLAEWNKLVDSLK